VLEEARKEIVETFQEIGKILRRPKPSRLFIETLFFSLSVAVAAKTIK